MKIVRSFEYAWAGLRAVYREQRNFRIHVRTMGLVFVAGLYFQIAMLEWCVVILSSVIVIGLELVNTSIEHLTDLVTKEQHPLAGKVKDIAAASVMVAAVGAIVVGIIIFAKYIIHALPFYG